MFWAGLLPQLPAQLPWHGVFFFETSVSGAARRTNATPYPEVCIWLCIRTPGEWELEAIPLQVHVFGWMVEWLCSLVGTFLNIQCVSAEVQVGKAEKQTGEKSEGSEMGAGGKQRSLCDDCIWETAHVKIGTGPSWWWHNRLIFRLCLKWFLFLKAFYDWVYNPYFFLLFLVLLYP